MAGDDSGPRSGPGRVCSPSPPLSPRRRPGRRGSPRLRECGSLSDTRKDEHMRHKTSWIHLSSLAVLLVSSGALAIEVRTGTEDFTLNVDGNLQFRNENIYDGPPPTATSGPAPSGHVNTDFFLRRASVSARGTAYKIFWYYVKLETGRFGARGNYSNPSLLQDVVVGFVPVADVYIEGGFLKTPLSRPAIDSSWRNNSLEGIVPPRRIDRGTRERRLQETALDVDVRHRHETDHDVLEQARVAVVPARPEPARLQLHVVPEDLVRRAARRHACPAQEEVGVHVSAGRRARSRRRRWAVVDVFVPELQVSVDVEREVLGPRPDLDGECAG